MSRIQGILSVILLAVSILLVSGSVSATTLSDVLQGISDARKPATLTSLTFQGDLSLNLDAETSGAAGLLPLQTPLTAAWRAPDDWLCTFELSGELATGAEGMGAGHPAVNHVLHSRPDFLDLLETEWTTVYQGSAVWEGDPAWQILFRPIDLDSPNPEFILYVSKDDHQPLRATADFPDGTAAVTDLTWVTIDGVLVPSDFTTVFTPPIGPLAGYRTAYYNHEVNPDLSGMQFPRQEGTIPIEDEAGSDEGPAVFEELYHGFADEPITAPISDSSGKYDRLEFTFSLYIEDPAVARQLNSLKDAVRDLAIETVSGREWSGDDGLGSIGGKYECGKAILRAIGEFLGTDAITDFYFIDFEPLAPEQD